MKKIILKTFYRNSLLREIINETDVRNKYDIPVNYSLYNIRINETGKTMIKEHDDMGPYWEQTLYEYKITVLFKEDVLK